MSNYNLLVEPWIPILRTDGRPKRVGIRDALVNAGRIRQFAASNPIDNVALLRLLLAVLQWSKPSLTSVERDVLRGASGIPPNWLDEKLGPVARPNPSFDLVADNGGFYQEESLTDVKSVAVTNLLHDMPSGTNIAHFRHVRDHRDGMCLACCATGLVRWSCVASAGTAGAGQSMTASINGNTPAYAVAMHADLLSTFLTTWPGPVTEGDSPQWDGAWEQSPLGFLKGMTFRSRRVLLAPADHTGKRQFSSGQCCHCGEQTDHLIKTVFFRPGWTRPYKQPWADDPHLLRVVRKIRTTGKQSTVIPSWPSPDDPSEDHARVWRSIWLGLLQSMPRRRSNESNIDTLMLAASQQLYKHASAYSTVLPRNVDIVAKELLEELEWLQDVTYRTLSARAGKRQWGDPPKGNVVVRWLRPGNADGYETRAKAHSVRSAFCVFSPVVERELERRFKQLAHDVASGDNSARSQWRENVRGIIARAVERVALGTVNGSSLRRLQAVAGARKAVNRVASVRQRVEYDPDR